MDVPEELISLLDDAIQISQEDLENRHEREMKERLEDQKLKMEERINSIVRRQLAQAQSTELIKKFDENPMFEDDQSESSGFSLRSFFGLNKYSSRTEINTGTGSMYAVAVVVERHTSFHRKMFVSICCLIFTWLQFFTLALVMMEASSPDCFSMENCPDGTFCSVGRFYQPTCRDCFGIYEHLNVTANYSTSECPTIVGESKWNQLDNTDIDHHELRLWSSSSNSSPLLRCLSIKHCIKNDIDAETNFKGHCDFLDLHLSQLDKRSWMLLMFLFILYTLPMSMDVEESAIEELVMDSHLNGSLSVPAEIVRLALRLRRCVIPFFSITATIVLLVTDDIMAKNIILNLLAIAFITEADNIVAKIFLRSSHMELMTRTVENLDMESLSGSHALFFWTRAQGFSGFILFVIGILWAGKDVEDCSELSQWFFELGRMAITTLVFCQGCYIVYDMTYEGKSIGLSIFLALNEVFRNLFIEKVSTIFFRIVSYLIDGDNTLLDSNKIPIKLSYSSIGVFVVLEMFRWNSHHKNKMKWIKVKSTR